MRKFTLFMMFSLVCFSLYGQIIRDPRIYVAPIEGFGKEADNDYINKRLAYEVILQYHRSVKSKYDSDYTFKGTTLLARDMPDEDSLDLVALQVEGSNPVPKRPSPPLRNISGRREFFSMKTGDEFYFYDSSGKDNTVVQKDPDSSDGDAEKKGYYFKLEMIDNRTEEVVGTQNFIFFTTDASVDKLISIAVYNLLSNIPEVPPKRGDSRDRWLYFDVSLVWKPSYYAGYEAFDWLSMGMRLMTELHFLSFMSFGAGVQISQEQITSSTTTGGDLILEVPATLKAVFKLSNKYALEPYGGASYNVALTEQIEPSMFSWFAGVQFGIKDISETGMFVFDLRYLMDFDSPVIPGDSIDNQRYGIQLAVGYKFGVIQKKAR